MLSRFKILRRKEKISLGILNKSCHAEKPRKTPSIHRQPDKFPGDTRFAPSPVTVPGSPFSISARRAISGRPLVEGERQREKEARTRGSALTPRRIISVSTDPSFWPARIFRPLRPTNFDQLTRKGMGSRHFPPVHVYALSCFPYTAARWLSTRVYRLCCCVQRPERMLWMRPA